MMRPVDGIALLASCLLLAACGKEEDEDALVCTTEVRPSVNITVVDELTDTNLAPLATGEIEDITYQGYVDGYLVGFGPAILSTTTSYRVGDERAGVFDVRVRHPGFREFDQRATVTAGDCHVTTAEVDARMTVNTVVALDSGGPDVTETDSLHEPAGCTGEQWGWEASSVNGVIELERLRTGCAETGDYDQLRLWSPPGSGPAFLNHRIRGFSDGISVDAAIELYLWPEQHITGGTMDIDHYDEGGIVAGTLTGVTGDGELVELVFWADLNR